MLLSMDPHKKSSQTSSIVTDSNVIAEVIINPETYELEFLVFDPSTDDVTRKKEIQVKNQTYVPPFTSASLCTTGIGQKDGMILLPTEAIHYGCEKDLEQEVRAFIHRYVELPAEYEIIATRYVMFTWLFDRFDEVPYLRIISHGIGQGKSRALETIGSVCYRPMLVAGSSTSASLRRLVDIFRGTLIGDEQDIGKDQDLTSSYIKMLNQGFQRGKLLTVCNSSGDEPTPQMFNIFGPKILVTRTRFPDDALESRCLNIPIMAKTRKNLPLNLPRFDFDKQALALRNKLLKFRFDRYAKIHIDPKLEIPGLEDRINQIGIPLLSTISESDSRVEIVEHLKTIQEYLIDDRSDGFEADIIRYLIEHWQDKQCKVYVKDVHSMLKKTDAPNKINFNSCPFTHKKVGSIIRDGLGFKTKRENIGYRVICDLARLEQLRQRYGLPPRTNEQSS